MRPMPTPTQGPTRAVTIGPVTFGGGGPFALIAGPCVIESREHCLRHWKELTRDHAGPSDVHS